MAGVNQAITENGEKYNKLARPDSFLASLAAKASTKEDASAASPQLLGSTKRTLDEADIDHETRDEIPTSKRSRIQNTKRSSSNTKKGSNKHQPVTDDYGMHSMFPGMIDENGSDDETSEALAYLRSVRSEAHSIPQLLVAAPRAEDGAPDRSMYNSGRGDMRAVYEDGAWIARDKWAPESTPSGSTDDLSELDPQEQYYKQLLRRYEAQRKHFQRPPSPAQLSRPKKDTEERVITRTPWSRHEWLHVLDREYPTPALLSGFDEQNVFRGLKYCAHSLDRFESITRQKGCWIWALLAKAPEVGVLDYMKAGSIRDLGHKAGQFGTRLRSGTARRPHSDEESEEEGEWEAEGDGIEEEVSEHSSAAESPEARASEKEDLSMALNGHTSKEHDSEESEVDMSMSEDEAPRKAEPKTLEEARERLLAQLGDRLIQPATSSITQDSGMEKTEKFDGVIPETEEGEIKDQEGVAQSKKVFNSRHEAEIYRQQLREKEQEKAQEKAQEQAQEHVHGKGQEHVQAKTQNQANKHEPDTATQQEDRLQREAANTSTSTSDVEPKELKIPDLNTRVTIDMILTVVAERYGQRDLLRFRELWDE